MHTNAQWIIAAAFLTPMLAVAAPQTWRFDPVHSQVWFSVAHQKFSHPQGRVRIAQGWFTFDDKDWSDSRVDVVIDLASVDMGDAKWNDAARSSALLDVARWPTAHYTSTRVERTDATHGIIHGRLDFRGETRDVDVAFTLNHIGNDPYAFATKAGFSAHATLHRFDFGMTRYKDVVGNVVDIRLEIEGIRDGDAATAPTRK